jgi:RimJ/RimL family protein N-acetyltransferase
MHSHHLSTARLHLRAPQWQDAPAIQRYASAPEVAATTLNIPHPYPENAAEEFIESLQDQEATGSFTFAIVRQADDQLIGLIGLGLDSDHQRAELGYWIGVPHWNAGYATEAVRRLIEFGFETLGANRIYAYYFTHNPASGRVMEKANMTYEGTLRQHVHKEGRFIDLAIRAILRDDWHAMSTDAASN